MADRNAVGSIGFSVHRHFIYTVSTYSFTLFLFVFLSLSLSLVHLLHSLDHPLTPLPPSPTLYLCAKIP